MFPAKLRREIVLLLAIKAGVLLAIYLFFFSAPHRPVLTDDGMRAHLLGNPAMETPHGHR